MIGRGRMATIVVERELSSSADQAWEWLQNVGDVHKAFPGVLLDSHLDDEGVRTVTFANGTVISEAIVGIDQARRRVAYSVVGGRFSAHMASIQIVAQDHAARLLWITDFLPDSAAPIVDGLMNRGADAFAAVVGGPASVERT